MKPAAVVRSAEGRASGVGVAGASAAMQALAVATWRRAIENEMTPGMAGVPYPNEVYVDEDRPRPFAFGFQPPKRRGMTRPPSRQARAAMRRRVR